jgi:hypothetical protein
LTCVYSIGFTSPPLQKNKTPSGFYEFLSEELHDERNGQKEKKKEKL